MIGVGCLIFSTMSACNSHAELVTGLAVLGVAWLIASRLVP